MTEVRTLKNELREKYLKIRDEMGEQLRQNNDKKIFDRLTASITYRHSNDILLYASFGSEVDTWNIFEAAKKAGKRVAFPRCGENNTMFYYYTDKKEDLEEKAFGILEPKDYCEKYNPTNFSLCIVPGLVFDKQGYRVGYGKGFYDRFLSRYKGVSMGLVYHDLLIDKVPRGRFDCHVDVMISERGVYAVDVQK